MNIIVACEYSGKVRDALIARGHNAVSCDLLPTESIGPHFQMDVLELIKHPEYNDVDKWDMIIAFPPCTHLASSGARWFKEKQRDGRQQHAIDFFMAIANCGIEKIVIENPVGIMSSKYRKPDQIIQPWQFGDSYSKKTCLWLKNVQPLKATNIVGKGEFYTYDSGRKMPKWYADAFKLPPEERAKLRSRTFTGIANAMAEQWTPYVPH
jgi:site-specific DNA-cytosine methylase